ncbi:hypothetical protein J6590_094678 [Homalodisca vitripennis]|nr:hypothetical protein J6590_094678 [Homalodisca vitripennis]
MILYQPLQYPVIVGAPPPTLAQTRTRRYSYFCLLDRVISSPSLQGLPIPSPTIMEDGVPFEHQSKVFSHKYNTGL